MASTFVLSLFVIVITVLQPALASSGLLAPLLSPAISNFCNNVVCGKGKCKVSEKSDFQYECECDPGWKQTMSFNASAFKFLPCVIPNCTLNYSCSEAAPPAHSREAPPSTSIFDPCHWANCGGGVCNKTSALAYECECKEGYYNLFNKTGFPCFKECSIGGDCSNLGIQVSNKSSASAPNLADIGSNQARSRQEEIFHQMVVLLMSIAFVL